MQNTYVHSETLCRYAAHLQPDRAQIDPPFPHRRTPEVDARHRARKRKQRVGRPVLGADHALQLRLEGVERLAEGDEYQPGARQPGPAAGAGGEPSAVQQSRCLSARSLEQNR